MPHQCVHCGALYEDGAEELLKGCSCGSHFFYYIRKEYFEKHKKEVEERVLELEKSDKQQIEKDVREIIGVSEEESVPVFLDLESVNIIEPGKFEIDIVNLFSKKRPLVYKLEEGKYIIDLAGSLNVQDRDIKFPNETNPKKTKNKKNKEDKSKKNEQEN